MLQEIYENIFKNIEINCTINKAHILMGNRGKNWISVFGERFMGYNIILDRYSLINKRLF